MTAEAVVTADVLETHEPWSGARGGVPAGDADEETCEVKVDGDDVPSPPPSTVLEARLARLGRLKRLSTEV